MRECVDTQADHKWTTSLKFKLYTTSQLSCNITWLMLTIASAVYLIDKSLVNFYNNIIQEGQHTAKHLRMIDRVSFYIHSASVSVSISKYKILKVEVEA